MNAKFNNSISQKLLTKNKKNDTNIHDSFCENNDFHFCLICTKRTTKSQKNRKIKTIAPDFCKTVVLGKDL